MTFSTTHKHLKFSRYESLGSLNFEGRALGNASKFAILAIGGQHL